MFDAIVHTKQYKADEEYAIAKSEEILKAIGLFEYRDTMAGNLAYGMQRKVEIARALALEPYILLLDEPAAGMNPLETQELMEFIEMLNEGGYTIAVIEHDMKFVMNSCNRILVLNFGQKICEGTPDEIKANKQVQEMCIRDSPCGEAGRRPYPGKRRFVARQPRRDGAGKQQPRRKQRSRIFRRPRRVIR